MVVSMYVWMHVCMYVVRRALRAACQDGGSGPAIPDCMLSRCSSGLVVCGICDLSSDLKRFFTSQSGVVTEDRSGVVGDVVWRGILFTQRS